MSRKYVVALLDISKENKVLQSILQFLYPISFHNLFKPVFPSSSKDSKRNPLLGGTDVTQLAWHSGSPGSVTSTVPTKRGGLSL